jgi:hypothetical protein
MLFLTLQTINIKYENGLYVTVLVNIDVSGRLRFGMWRVCVAGSGD